MKYVGRIFCMFLILFLLSELSYSVSADIFVQKKAEAGTLEAYEERMDRSEIRLKGNAGIVWKAEGLEAQVEEWMNLRPCEYAGMNETEFLDFLKRRQPAPAMVELGLTDFALESFASYEAVIVVKKEEAGNRRFDYWCQLQGNRIAVFDSLRHRLILEQALVKPRFSAEELRQLQKGCFLETYEDVIRLLRQGQAVL